MAYSVPPLPYDYSALEPHIDEETMKLHHDKHHQAYVDKANDALAGTEWEDKPVEEALQNLSSLPVVTADSKFEIPAEGWVCESSRAGFPMPFESDCA